MAEPDLAPAGPGLGSASGSESANPFVRYRDRLDSYAAARAGGLSDGHFVDLVETLDAAVAEADGTGHGFRVTPTVAVPDLAVAAGFGEGVSDLAPVLWVKVEVDNVAGSHKGRHLFGSALHLLVQEALGAPRAQTLAISSCGNAALAAGVIAAALGRELQVFVPTWADRSVVVRLEELGADIRVCERRDGEVGDPCHHRFREAVAGGARAFSVQATDTPTAFDGGRTLGWELADQVPTLDAVCVQVGGGALATAVSLGLDSGTGSGSVPARNPVALFPVQSEGCAPLRRAWDLLAPEFDWDRAAAHPDEFMWPWESEPSSAATGILDDVTYDWLPLLERTRATGGEPIVVPEPTIVDAHALARSATGIAVSATGTAGFAGLIAGAPTITARLRERAVASERPTVAVIFTGTARDGTGPR